jgi:hypothetical protein
MAAIYLTIVFSLLACFIIRWTKIKSEFLLRLFKTLHRPVFIILLVNIVLLQFNWSIIGGYTNQILILTTVMTGIFTHTFLKNQNRDIKPPRYFKILFRVCLILTIIGAVPVIFPYGGGLVFQLFARNYTLYNLNYPYYLKRSQYGINHCYGLSLCKNYLLLEREIPIYQVSDVHYDCFGDMMQVTITESKANKLKAHITMPYNSDTTDLTLNYGSNTMEVTNHVWYGIKTYKIDFSNLQYKTTYSLKTENETMQDR